MSLGGKPRSLELDEDLEETITSSRDAKSALKSINAVDSSTVSSKFEYVPFTNRNFVAKSSRQVLHFDHEVTYCL